jgi:hypothetical protein
MDRVSVASSNIESIGYDEKSQTMEVAFLGGRIYQYFGVPKGVYAEIIQASSIGDSVGGYLNRNIKGQYRYARV